MIKKTNHSKIRINKLMGKGSKQENKKDYDEIEKQKEERRQKKIQNKILGKKLGYNQQINSHLDVYSGSLKHLVNELTDDNIAWFQMG